MKIFKMIMVVILLVAIFGITIYFINRHYKDIVDEIRQTDSLYTITLRDSIHALQINVDSLSHIPPIVIIKPHTIYLPGDTISITQIDTIMVYPFGHDVKKQTFNTENKFYQGEMIVYGTNTIISDVIVYSDSTLKEWYITNDLTFKQDSLGV